MTSILDKIIAAGGDVFVVGGDLRLRVPKGLLTAAERSILADNKAAIVKLLADTTAETPVVVAAAETVVVATVELAAGLDLDQQAEPVEFTMPGGLTIRFAEPEDEETVVVAPPPCQQCGGFMVWWDIAGGVHCLDCDPPLRSQRLREQAERIRRRGK